MVGLVHMWTLDTLDPLCIVDMMWGIWSYSFLLLLPQVAFSLPFHITTLPVFYFLRRALWASSVQQAGVLLPLLVRCMDESLQLCTLDHTRHWHQEYMVRASDSMSNAYTMQAKTTHLKGNPLPIRFTISPNSGTMPGWGVNGTWLDPPSIRPKAPCLFDPHV